MTMKKKKILVLHGNRQTGELLLGRMSKFRKKLLAHGIELIAIDAPFPFEFQGDTTEEVVDGQQQEQLKTWWHRDGNTYHGLEECMQKVQEVWNNSSSESEFIGLMGFSQGARLVHLLASLDCLLWPEPQFVIIVAGYDAPIPTHCRFFDNTTGENDRPIIRKIDIPSLHVWGKADKLIEPLQSESVMAYYEHPECHVHTGGHHVPMRAENVRIYLNFITQHLVEKTGDATTENENAATATAVATTSVDAVIPDEEHQILQIEEVQVLQAMYPDEMALLSKFDMSGDNENVVTSSELLEFPISYRIDITPTSSEDETIENNGPSHPIHLKVTYPPLYPTLESPIFQLLVHDDNQHHGLLELFSSSTSDDQNNNALLLLQAIRDAAKEELGMPCILSCLYTARDWFFKTSASIMQNSIHDDEAAAATVMATSDNDDRILSEDTNDDDNVVSNGASILQPVSEERIRECNLEGLQIAEDILATTTTKKIAAFTTADPAGSNTAKSSSCNTTTMGKGGSWLYTIGLVGKPSAGKSTIFNTATGFARQKQQQQQASTSDNNGSFMIGGATMAPHPFTTIDPNIGFCLVPAPAGSCPEDDEDDDRRKIYGSTHGRDHLGRRLLPVLLKDVAGLVPGAYQGRGRGNQFLNDLTDADVLIHVSDASGLADTEGNIVADVADNIHNDDDDSREGGASNALDDMAWIRNELIEWVFTNLTAKWDTIRRRGRNKLVGMFSGYGQPQAMTLTVLNAIEQFMDGDHDQNHLDKWDAGDVHRLVSAFLGVRFPIAIALNKMDLSSSKENIANILDTLPIHGTHVGVPLSARQEMQFVRRYIEASVRGGSIDDNRATNNDSQIPTGTLQCLQSAIRLREPILVFPVSDHKTYAPLPGMFKYATGDPSLPSPGMIACLEAVGGCRPTEFEPTLKQYATSKSHTKRSGTAAVALRDALLMKPGSTVEDVFLTLKKLGALSGEFVRAEATGNVGAPAKPVPKHQLVSKRIRIIKIMTNKRTARHNV